MFSVFLKLLNMSITAGWIVLAVVIFRVLFPKAPKWINCLLWGVVGLRLMMPFAVESTVSLIPSAEVLPLDIAVSQTPAIHSGFTAVNNTINPLFTLYLAPGEDLLQEVLSVAAVVWLAGMGLMLIYSAITYLRLHWQVRASLLLRENIYLCDAVDSPFVMGILRPRIYLPSGMDEAPLAYVLAHEKAHIRRRDHWWKPLGFFLLSVHWFNPLLWLAYILLCRDIEQACDEKVIAGMDNGGKKGYSEALVACSVHRRMVMACPLAFGELSVKSRIKGVLHYKKPTFWLIMVSAAACIVAVVCFLTNPVPCQHDYTGQITRAATCTRRGVETRTCQLCQHSYTASVDKLAHSYDVGVVTQEPTCTDVGTRTYTCVDCGKQQTQKIAKTPHVAGGPIQLTAANCTDKGQKLAACVYCQQSFVAEVLQPNDVHDMHETVLTAASCTEPGEGVHTCSRCGLEEGCAYAATGHDYTLSMSIPATCKSFGYKIYNCTLCGEEAYEEISTTSHSWVYAGNGYQKCTYCGFRMGTGGTSAFVESPFTKTPADLVPLIPIIP